MTHRDRPAGCSLVWGPFVIERIKNKSQWDKTRGERQWDKRGQRTLTCRRCVRGAGPPGRSRSQQSRRRLSSRRIPRRPCDRCETSGLLRSWASTPGTGRPSSRKRTLNSPGDRRVSCDVLVRELHCIRCTCLISAAEMFKTVMHHN